MTNPEMEDKDFKALLQDDSFIDYCLERNPESVARWQNWLKEHPEHRAQVEELKQFVVSFGRQAGNIRVTQSYQRLQTRIAQNHDRTTTPSVFLSPWLRYAAAIVVLISVGLFLYVRNGSGPETADISDLRSNIVPGGDKAMLTLADGSSVSLTDAAVGALDIPAEIAVTKTAAGRLVYSPHVLSKDPKAGIGRHRLETPRGGQFQVTLPDGSMAWLNAASSLSYPVAFAADERAVEMTGEVYFEIAKDKSRPFRVKAGAQTVEVLGTRFNINAYADEPVVRTTLVEGSVKITMQTTRESVLLKPGQQADVVDHIMLSAADLSEAVAWKNGDFIFNNESLPGILRKISRWYNVEVVYPATMPDVRFNGMVSRSRDISAVLNMIESTGKVHFKMEERRIIIMN